MKTVFLLLALSGMFVGSAPAAQQDPLDGEELTQVLETAIEFTLQTGARYSKPDASQMQTVFDTSSSFGNLRESGVTAQVRLPRALNVGRELPLVSRDKILACPSQVLSSSCTFVKPATNIWIGTTRRVSATRVSILVHVMSPSESTVEKNRVAGYSMEVIVWKDLTGRWTSARMGKVVTG